jgi:hypothetical protein
MRHRPDFVSMRRRHQSSLTLDYSPQLQVGSIFSRKSDGPSLGLRGHPPTAASSKLSPDVEKASHSGRLICRPHIVADYRMRASSRQVRGRASVTLHVVGRVFEPVRPVVGHNHHQSIPHIRTDSKQIAPCLIGSPCDAQGQISSGT